MTTKQGAARLKRISKAFPVRMRTALSISGAKGVVIAHKWSSGPIKSDTLRRMGHPYGIRTGSKKRGPVPQPVGLINRQESLFYNAWLSAAASGNASSLKQAVQNVAPYAKYLKTGTTKMIARPIIALIKTDLQPVFRRTVRQYVGKALNTP